MAAIQNPTDFNREHHEGPVARSIEQETAKLPSDAFLWAALGSIGASLILQIAGKKEISNFVGALGAYISNFRPLQQNRKGSWFGEVFSRTVACLAVQPLQRVIGIGASADGLEALRALVARIPGEVEATLLIVQHSVSYGGRISQCDLSSPNS
jgi:chemotaxis response regulator CheB